MLARHEGNWQLTMRAWMSPNDPPMEGTGTSTIRSLLSGRILTEEVHGDMHGMPFEGFGTMGYDNFHRKYWQTWTDWMTSLYHADGTGSPDGKTITFTGKMDRPEQGRKDVETRTVYRFLSNDRWIFEMHNKTPDGKEVKGFEIEYRRK